MFVAINLGKTPNALKTIDTRKASDQTDQQ